MSELSKEEIIEILKGYDAKNKKCLSCAVPNREACVLNESDCIDEAIQGLLDLYNKEKEKREIAEENYKVLSLDLGKALKELGLYEDTIIADELVLEINKRYISKDKIKWKPISEYNREKYDWVLVKYFDGDYECVPEVAEQRWDGKWYTTEREIPFEVKYFFDMQELLEERN